MSWPEEERGTYEAVELVRHGGGVDGLVGEVVERRREAVVVRGVLYLNEPKTGFCIASLACLPLNTRTW